MDKAFVVYVTVARRYRLEVEADDEQAARRLVKDMSVEAIEQEPLVDVQAFGYNVLTVTEDE